MQELLRRFYSLSEVAEILGVDKGVVYSLIFTAQIQAYKFARDIYRIPEYDLERFIVECQMSDEDLLDDDLYYEAFEK
ncbi:helix-turn-helix domain-containing protein [Priestia megaterium]|uniref:helix-turn-helix domain-containing protein n=1 Tax=Priestia megaterium TaxID=1404 RepID=UPI002FE349D8